MMENFNTSWKSSSKPKKQRKYRINAPLHIKSRFLKTHLSPELSKKFSKRTCRVKTGDKVKVMSGQFKGKSGKVEEIDTKKSRVIINGIDIQKAEGNKIRIPIAISNIMITELVLDDKKRQEALKRK